MKTIVLFFALILSSILSSAQTQIQIKAAAGSAIDVLYKNIHFKNSEPFGANAEMRIRYYAPVEYTEIKTDNDEKSYTLCNDVIHQYSFKVDGGNVAITNIDGKIVYSRSVIFFDNETITESKANSESQKLLIEKAKAKMAEAEKEALELKNALMEKVFKSLSGYQSQSIGYTHYSPQKGDKVSLSYLTKGCSPTYTKIMGKQDELSMAKKLAELK